MINVAENYCRIGEVNVNDEMCLKLIKKKEACEKSLCEHLGEDMVMIDMTTSAMIDGVKEWIGRYGKLGTIMVGTVGHV